LRRFLRYALIAGGASAVISAVIGVISAYQLIEPSDQQAVGIGPGDFVGFYAVMFVLGGAMIYAGWRLRE
jgi:hypothetical protein